MKAKKSRKLEPGMWLKVFCMLSCLGLVGLGGSAIKLGPAQARPAMSLQERDIGEGGQADIARKRIPLPPFRNRSPLSIQPVGVPLWVEQGPGPLDDISPVSAGAIEAIATYPDNPAWILVGTVNGGVWRTYNGTTPFPDGPAWVPLTDHAPSLSISSLAFDPLDTSDRTIYAGTGNTSSGGYGGPAVGILRTTDGGDSWGVVGQNELAGKRLRSVLPTSIKVASGQVIMAAAIDSGGLYRSTDGGASFTLMSGLAGSNLPSGGASDLVADPGNTHRFYTAVVGQGQSNGIYRSTDTGATWTLADQLIPTGTMTSATRISLAVHNNTRAGTNAVYAAVVGRTDGQVVSRVFRSPNHGNTWTAMDPQNLGGQAESDLSILADRTNANIVYVNGTGGDPSGPFMGDASKPAGKQWAAVAGSAAGNTQPHADSRDMIFDANGDILESDDGGIYRLVDPKGTDPNRHRRWEPLDGDLRITEFYSVAYDSVHHTIFGAAQDNGIGEQRPGTRPGQYGWHGRAVGDGTLVGVDNQSSLSTSFHYSSGQYLQDWQRNGTPVELVVNNAGGKTLRSVQGAPDPMFDSSLTFDSSYVINKIDPRRMLIGSSFIYESTDQGRTVTSLGGLTDLNHDGIDNDNDGKVDEGDEFQPANPVGTFQDLNHDGIDNDNDGKADEGNEFVFTGTVTTTAYGGRFEGANNPRVAYVGTETDLRLRTETSNTFTRLAGYPGGYAQDIVLDPDDWHTAYVIIGNSQVWRVTNAGQANEKWEDITGNLGGLTNDIRTIEIYSPSPTPGDEIVLVGGWGGVFRTLDPGASTGTVWSTFGRDLPNTYVLDLHYDATDDVLVAGTFGRSAWKVSNAGSALVQPGVLRYDGGDSPFGENVRLVREASTPSILDVFVNGAKRLSVPLSSITGVVVNGGGANITLTIDCSNGSITLPQGISYDGGTGSENSLIVEGGLFDTITYSPNLPSTNLAAGTIDFKSSAPGQGDMSVTYNRVQDVEDTTTAGNLTFNGTDGADNLQLYDETLPGSMKAMLIKSVGNQRPGLMLANKSFVQVNALGGNDTILVDNLVAPAGLSTLSIDPGQGSNNVKIATTCEGAATTVYGTGGSDNVYVGGTTGSGGSLANIRGPLTVGNTSRGTLLSLDDSSDIRLMTATLSDSSLTGLSPMPVNWLQNGIVSLTVGGSGGGNIFNVNNTGGGYTTTILGGRSIDKLNVAGTFGPLDFNGAGFIDYVSVGQPLASGASTLSYIVGPVSVRSTGGNINLAVDGSGDTRHVDATITGSAVTGLAPAAISYVADPNPFLNGLTVSGGMGGNTFTVVSTNPSYATTINSGKGADRVNVLSTAQSLAIDGNSGNDSVFVGRSLSNVKGALSVTNTAGLTALTLDDTSSTTGKPGVVLATGTVKGLSPIPVTYAPARTSSLLVNAGSGGNIISVADTGPTFSTTLNSGQGNDRVNVRGTTGALLVNGNKGADRVVIGSTAPDLTKGLLSTIKGVVSIDNTAGTTDLTVNDGGEISPAVASIGDSSIAGLVTAPITYVGARLSSLTVNGGSGGNTFNVAGAIDGVTRLNTGKGPDTVNVTVTPRSHYTNLLVDGGLPNGGNAGDTLNVTDSTRTSTISNTLPSPSGPGIVRVNYPIGFASIIRYAEIERVVAIPPAR